MIKLRSGNNIVLGLSARNVQLLEEGKPIYFQGAELGFPQLEQVKFFIVYGETEDAILKEMGIKADQGHIDV